MTNVDSSLPNPPLKPELRVLQVFGTLGIGGAEKWLLSLLRYFNESSIKLPYNVTTDICLTSGEPNELDEEAIRLGARLHYLRYSRRHVIGFARNFRRLLAKGRFHAIHDHQDYSAGVHFLLGAGVLPPVRIAHVHNTAHRLSDQRDALSQLVGSVGDKVLRYSNATVIGTSQQLLTEYGFSDSGPTAARPLYCGFDVASYIGDSRECRRTVAAEFGWGPSDPVILFVGRLGEDERTAGLRSLKNPMFALDVYERCFSVRSDLRLLFVGEKGPMYEVLSARTTERNLHSSVKFLGLRHDVSKLMLGSALLLFPSSAEGLGMVAVEAQAAGLPVLASDTIPTECVVVPELVSFLPLSAGTQVWANKLLAILSLQPVDRLRSNAAVAASAFSIVNSANALLGIYAGGTATSAKRIADRRAMNAS